MHSGVGKHAHAGGQMTASMADRMHGQATRRAATTSPGANIGRRGNADLLTVYLGDRLGLYRALSSRGRRRAAELAARAGTASATPASGSSSRPPAASWTSTTPPPAAEHRRYALPAGHAEVLTERDSLNYLAYLGRFAAGLGGAAPAIAGAFRSGAGVSWADLGPDLREGQAEQNRPIFLNLMGRAWLPAIPTLDARLRRAPRPRRGWRTSPAAPAGRASPSPSPTPRSGSTATTWTPPRSTLARANAAGPGVAGRVRFHVRRRRRRGPRRRPTTWC